MGLRRVDSIERRRVGLAFAIAATHRPYMMGGRGLRRLRLRGRAVMATCLGPAVNVV